MKLTFLGATGTVTGSKYLIENEGKKLLVDCGLFQGRKDLRLRNWAKLPIAPGAVDAVLLTHAHLDHSGYLPLLAREGFKGPVYCSEGTADLCKLLLPDSGHIQEEDAEHANRHGYSKHSPALALYTEADAEKCLRLLKPVSLGEAHALPGGLSFSLHRAGHILGACMIKITDASGTAVLFTGDLGRMENPVMKPPAKMQETDYLVIESTYGDRLHATSDCAAEIARVVRETIARGGTVLIPAFAVGRAQEIMYYLHQLKERGEIPAHLPVYLDSPMAISASDLLLKHAADHRLPPGLCRAMCDSVTYTHTPEESKALDANPAVPKIIISASGMATGGRILHHFRHYLGDRRHTVLLSGFQAEGTRGERLLRGEKELKFHGQIWRVEAQVEKIDGMSAHADYSETLAWLGNFTSPPRKVFITHGEPAAAQSLQAKIHEKFGWEAETPEYLESADLG